MRLSGLLIFMFVAAGGLTLMSSAPAGAGFQCVQLTDSRNSIICAPPRGQLMQNVKGRYVCSPGRCVTLSSGGIVCSAVPGGAIALDSLGRAICFGGCVEPAESMCVTPIVDKS